VLLANNASVRRMWLAQLASQLGDWLDVIALFELSYRLGGDASSVGMVLVLQQLPLVVWSPLAGHLADRYDRRTLLIACDLARAGIVLGFLFVDQPGRMWLLYLVAAAQHSVGALFEPARRALLQTVVDPDDAPTVNALDAATYGATGALGCLLGGMMVASAGEHAAFIADAATFVFSALQLLALRTHEGSRHDSRRRDASPGGSLRSYLAGDPRLVAAIGVKLVVGLIGGAFWLVLVMYGQRLFPIGQNGATSVGILNAVMFLGAALAPTLAARLLEGNDEQVIRGIGWFFAIRTACLGVLAAATTLTIAAAAAAGLVIAAIGCHVSVVVLIQRLAPDGMRGRLYALENAVETVGVVISAQAAGWLIDRGIASPRDVALLLAGVMVVASVLWRAVVVRWPNPPAPVSSAASPADTPAPAPTADRRTPARARR
jgi:MFS family permease